jgi:Na+(H+)/acetate symporter ActP
VERQTAVFPLPHDWHWFPLSNPGIISIPAGFFFGWLGTMLSREKEMSKVRGDGGSCVDRGRRALM